MSEDSPDDPLGNVTPLRPGDLDPVPEDMERGPPAPDDELRARLEAAGKFALNDFGNGQRFKLHFGQDAMFVPRVGWFNWTGKVWHTDPDEMVVRAQAQKLGALIEREIPFLALSKSERAALDGRAEANRRLAELVLIAERTDEQNAELRRLRQRIDAAETLAKSVAKRRAHHRAFAVSAGNSQKITNAMLEASVALAVPFEDLDVAPLDVNTESGVLRFSVTDMAGDGAGRVAEVALVPHTRDQRMTKIVAAKYDANAPHPLFDAFLERIQPDREMREFLKRWLGLAMSGVPMQRLVFFHGGGANGKSVLVDLIARILGNYAATARIESLTGTNRRGGGDATPDLIPLMGARFVRTSEPDEGQRLQEGLIKELTGGEPILVRALQKDFVEVLPIFKLTMSGNHKPDIRGTDDGIWRRVLLVPFDVQIPESERDRDLVNKLFVERDGILNWLIEGLCDFLEGGLRPPEAVASATREYREESDPIGVFLTSCCTITGQAGDTILSKDFGHAFTYHLLERGMSPWKPTTFARQIAVKSRQWRHPETGRKFAKGKASVSQYVGIRLTDAFRRRFDDAPKDHNGRPLGVSAGARDDGGTEGFE